MNNKPRIHPNGFIQLDLANDTRLHVWPDGAIPRQGTVNTIHDHKFDMTSTVLCGELIQLRYHALPEGHEFMALTSPTHEVYQAEGTGSQTRNSILQPTGNRVEPSLTSKVTLKAGESYTQPRYTLHDTQWNGLTATLMHKSNTDTDYNPRVLCPIGAPPDNDYDRWKADEDLMWDYIHRAMALSFPFYERPLALLS